MKTSLVDLSERVTKPCGSVERLGNKLFGRTFSISFLSSSMIIGWESWLLSKSICSEANTSRIVCYDQRYLFLVRCDKSRGEEKDRMIGVMIACMLHFLFVICAWFKSALNIVLYGYQWDPINSSVSKIWHHWTRFLTCEDNNAILKLSRWYFREMTVPTGNL